MRIGEVAAKSGVSVRSLRYYEEQQLLSATRTPGGQRNYSETAVEQVKLIQQFYAAGLPSRTIRELLPCMRAGALTRPLTARLQTERDRIRHQIEMLNKAQLLLEGLIADADEPGGQ
jgi:MerR family transcriptional regulator, redox-sensitive transcriptional activator SoxR